MQDKSSKGFTLLEMIFTIFILTVGIVGIYGAITRMISQSADVSDRLIASYLAQEGIEITRNLRDGNWLEDEAAPGTVDWDDGFNFCSMTAPQSGCEADFNETTAMSAYGAAGSFLYFDANGFYSYTGADQTKFKRKIIVTDVPPTAVSVKVEVYWDDKTLSVEERLHNWK